VFSVAHDDDVSVGATFLSTAWNPAMIEKLVESSPIRVVGGVVVAPTLVAVSDLMAFYESMIRACPGPSLDDLIRWMAPAASLDDEPYLGLT
jgi:hypothetical protein